MRFRFLFAVAIGLIGTVTAQAPVLNLVGDRFKPLTYEQLTPEQKTMADNLLSGERRSLGGPFNVLLRSPDMGDSAQKLGAYFRFRSSLPSRLNELAIIITARYWTSQFEWTAHKRAALQAGVSAAVVDAIAEGKRPTGMQKDEEVVYNFCDELLKRKQVTDATFQAAVGSLGERQVVDLVGVMGYYQFVAMLLNVDRYPSANELKPLPNQGQ